MMSEGKYSEWLPASARQNLTPVYSLFGILDEAERTKLLERATIKTCSDLGIFTKEDMHRFSNDPVGMKIIEDKLTEKSIDCINACVVAEAGWQQTSQRIDRYLEDFSAIASFGTSPPSREAVRDAIFLAQDFIRNTLPDVTDDQLDEAQHGLFFHAITDCLIAAQKKAEEKANPLSPSNQTNALSELARLHVYVLDKLLEDLPKADSRKILQESKKYTCKTLGIRDEQFLSCINNPNRTVDVARIFVAEVKLGIREYRYMRRQMNIIERRIDAYLREPGKSSSTIKTPTRDEVRGVIEQASIDVQMKLPNAHLDGKDQQIFHDRISELLNLETECKNFFLSESYSDLANTVLPTTRKPSILGKYQA